MVFAVVIALLRLVYTVWFCPYDLAEDEANYWVWSTHLDWSYYTKGPGIAWAMRAATSLFGTSEPSIRLVAVGANFITTLSVAAMAGIVATERPAHTKLDADHNDLTVRVTDWRAALYAAAAVQLSPIFQGTAIFSTIDGPYAACWAVAALAALLAVMQGRAWAWAVCGAALGVGFLFKYTILLLVPGIIGFVVLARHRLSWPPRSGRWAALGILFLLMGFAPVVVWNIRNDGATVAHLLGHLGMKGGDMPTAPAQSAWRYQPKWTIEFLASQFGMVGPLLVLGGCAAVARLKLRPRPSPGALPESVDPIDGAPRPDPRPLRTFVASRPIGSLFLVAAAAPILLFYLGVSFIAEPEGNWAMGGYVTLLALAGCGAAAGMASFRHQVAAWRALPEPRPKLGVTRRKPEAFVQVLWHTSLIYGIVSGVVMLRLDWVMSITTPIVHAIGPTIGIKPERLYSGRAKNLLDARRMGMNANGHADFHLRQPTGLKPFYIAQHYGTASVLSFYIPGRPLVLCSSGRMGGRPTPWDFWAGASLDDPALLGRPALLLGARKEQWEPMFERVEPLDTPTGRLEGEHKQGRFAFLGFGYKGWPKPTTP